MMEIHPVTLTGPTVILEPLRLDHAVDLLEVSQDASIWTYMRYGQVDTLKKMREFIQMQLDYQAEGLDLPFAVIFRRHGRAIGMTRYMDIQPSNHGLEIGGTWYGVDYQHTGVNTECKYLLLTHAFETLGCVRVQFKADARNQRSLDAIQRIGAVREGLLRNHMILPDGTLRSSVYFSILAGEWPAVKSRLESLMQRSRSPSKDG